jgi:phosphate transport system substrate-binding protein
VVSLPDGSGTKSVFEGRMLGDTAVEPGGNSMIAETNGKASEIMTENEGALASVSYAFQREANPLTLINECGIAMVPDAFSAPTEEYALQRRLYMYSREDMLSENLPAFLDFATSPDADSLIGKAGFIGFAVVRRVQLLDGARPCPA